MSEVKLLDDAEVATIMRFYNAETSSELIAHLCAHIERLQEKLQRSEHPLRRSFELISPRIG